MVEQNNRKNDFDDLEKFIYQTMGIKIPDSEKTTIESRLSTRLKALKLNSFFEYHKYLFSQKGNNEEVEELVNIITSSNTDFFSEPEQFNYLVNTTLPQIITRDGSGLKTKLILWCCGCSNGMEAYTLAMILTEFSVHNPGLDLDFMILATDISNKILNTGINATYDMEAIASIPEDYLKKYLLKSKKKKKGLIKIAPAIRNKVKFRELNLLKKEFNFREQFDLVFFRNVMIYFNESTNQHILKNIFNNMKNKGYLFIGNSETINPINPGLDQIGPSIFQKN